MASLGLIGALAAAHAYAYANEAPTPAAIAAQRTLEVLPSGHPVVLVGIDESAPKRFVLDTAASMTTIMPKLRADLPGIVAVLIYDGLSMVERMLMQRTGQGRRIA